MADEVASLVVKITGDTSDLESTIGQVERELNSLSDNMQKNTSVTNSNTSANRENSSSQKKSAQSQKEKTQSTEENTKKTDENTKSQKNNSKALKETGKSWKEYGEGVDSVTKPIQYASVALATGGVAAAKFAIDFEDSFASVEKTVEGTPEQLERIKQGIIDLSTTGIDGRNAIPLSTEELNALVAAGGQLGIETENIVEFTETMAMLQSATNLVGEEGASTMARYANVMKIPQTEIKNVGSAIVDLGNNSATTEAEIADMALRMGKYGQTVRMGAADVLGYSAALSSLGIEAQLGGSAVGRTWLSIETAVASGGDELKTFAKSAGVSAKEFKEQWNTDSKGAFNGLLKGLQSAENLTLALDDLGINNTQDIQAMMALVNGYDLVAESVERANTAYAENTALQEEFDKKAETTASKLAVAKNNLVETARGIGETLLPTIADASTDVAEFAKKLAGMSDESKKTLVNIAGGVIAVGAASKGLAVGTKTVGDFIEGWGKIKNTKVWTTIAKGFAAIPGPAKLAVAGIAAVGVASKIAYDAWYNSQYRWSNGLSEGNEKIQESLNKYKSLTEIQNQIKSLKLIIENPDSSKEQVEDAKKKLEDIKELLSEEYDLVINSDNSNLDDTLDNLIARTENELQRKLNTQQLELNSKADKAQEYRDNQDALAADLQVADDAYTKYDTLNTALQTLGANYRDGKISQADYTDGMVELGEQLGYTEEEVYNMDVTMSDLMLSANTKRDAWGKVYETRKQQLADLSKTYEEYQTISEEMIEDRTEMIGLAAQKGDTAGIQEQIEFIKTLVKNAGLDMKDYAQAIEDASGGTIKAADLIAEAIESIPEEHNTEITAEDKASEVIEDVKNEIATIKDKTVTVTVKAVGADSVAAKIGNTGTFKPNAKGTQNFSGGLAMVNDQTGISDNRELIIDRGRAFIPQGQNVILPLSKGAKVYTASQTQAIMRGLDIPHYASGKNNSDAFTSAKDDWNHYTKTHVVTTAQELEKWLKFQERYKDNEKDIWDIEEQIFSLQQKLYSERVQESEKWLEHEEKYNGMSVSDYLEGIDRMKEYTAEYYAQGIISHEEYNDALLELDEKYLDKRKEQLEKMYDASVGYISEHTYFNDWSDYGDDPLDAYNRVKERQKEALENGELTQEEYNKYMSEIGSTMLGERTEQSKNWLDEQRKYFGMTDEEYVAGLNRIKAYTQQYYDEGLINRQEYNEAMTELNHSIWDEAETAYDEMLLNQQTYISDLKQQFSEEEQAIRDSWTVDDRATDMSDVQAQLDVYANAVTDKGQQKYKELQEQMKQLQREEELYQLEVANNAVIEKLEAEYEQLEADKADYLKGIAQNTDIDVSGIVGSLTADIQSTGSNITSLLSQILSAFGNFKVESTNYTDMRNVVNNISQLPSEQLQALIEMIGK